MALAGNVLPDNLSDFEGGTHAWTQGSNTTLAINSGGTISGDKSVRATATAAGSVSATSARFAVTAGTNYEISVPLRISQQKAGRNFTVTVTWYTALSGGSQIGTDGNTITVRSDVGSGWWVDNYNVFYATAPANAVAATLTIQVTGLAAAEYVHIDRLEFAPAVLLEGNLLDYNTQSNEKDTSGWTITNGSLTRVSGVAVAGTGSYLARAQSNGSGAVTVSSVAKPSVTPGEEYRFYVWLWYQDAAGLPATAAIRWYDSGDSLISTTEAPWSLLQTPWPVCAVGTAPANAATAQLEFTYQASSAGMNVYFDQAWLCVAPNVEGNLLTYDEYSSESGVQPWTIEGPAGSPSLYTLTSGVTDGYEAMAVTPTGTGFIRGSLDRLVPVEPGKTYKVGAVCWRHNSNPGSIVTSAFRMLVDWYDAEGNIFQADEPDQFYVHESSDEWYGHSNTQTRTCPEGAAFARVIFEIDHGPTGGDAYYLDGFKLFESEPEYVLEVSDERGVITLTVNSEPSYGPEGTVSVHRVHADGSMVPLRGYGVEYDRAPYSGSPMVIEDYEAPLGETVWYKIDWYKIDGTRGARLYTRSVRTPVLDNPDYVWFKSPGLPAVNTRVMMEAPPTWQRAARSATYSIVGRTNPVHVSSVRAGRTAQITLLVWDEPSNELFNRLLDNGLPALIQATPGYGIDGNLYVSIGDSEVESITGAANEPGWRWTLPITEIDRPVGGMQGSTGVTWQNIADGYDTWDDVFAAYETWAKVLTEG